LYGDFDNLRFERAIRSFEKEDAEQFRKGAQLKFDNKLIIAGTIVRSELRITYASPDQ
jgi:hypothetical protein